MKAFAPHPPHPRLVLALGLGVVLACGLAVPAASADIVDAPVSYSSDAAALNLSPLGSYQTGTFDESAAEIVTYFDGRLFVVNAAQAAVDVLSIEDPSSPAKLYGLAAEGAAISAGGTVPAGATANSVAVRADGLGVMAIESPTKTDAGWLVFFDADAADATVLGAVEVGALPDMVTISADGTYAVSADEGEPNDDFTVDPEGSVSVVTLPADVSAPAQSAVSTADFNDFEVGGSKILPADVRIFGPDLGGNRVSTNLEPEYAAIDPNGLVAYVALQEANAVAVVDLASAEVTEIWPLGFQDHGIEGQGIDASDRDPEGAPTMNIRSYPGLRGMFMPDGLNSYSANGSTYLVSANEGDAREWGDYVEGARVKDLGAGGLLPVCADSPLAGLTGDADLGRLNVTTENGLNAAGTCYEELYSFGSRSFSIWSTDGTRTFDSGEDFERITAAANPAFFNSSHTESSLEGRSDDKGPEPENLAIGDVDGRTYAFIGLERVGGIMVYDIENPNAARFVTYINNRDFAVSMEASVDAGTAAADLPLAGDLGPEGVAFIAAGDSASGVPMLAVGNEVSGTTTLFAIGSGPDAAVSGFDAVPAVDGAPGDAVAVEQLAATGAALAPAALLASLLLLAGGVLAVMFRRRA